MKTKMQRIGKAGLLFAGVSLLCVTGCYQRKPAQSSTASSNPQINVELVLVNDGVKVYRFHDGMRYIYYTDARGSTQWTETQGKVQVPVRVETVK